MRKLRVSVQLLPHGEALGVPAYMTEGSSGLDLVAAVGEEIVVDPLERVAVPTGLAVALPDGVEGQVRPRSGLALKSGVTVLNAPGTIDSDYRGEIYVLLVNLGSSVVVIRRGDRIAQLVLAPVRRAELVVVSELPGTARGAGGLGHTGE